MLIYKAKIVTNTFLFKNSLKVSTLAFLFASLVACGGGSGSSDNNTDLSGSENIDPSGSEQASLEIVAEPDSIQAGQISTITWQTVNSVSCRAENGWTSDTRPSGSVIVGPMIETTTFSMSCLGKEGGPITESITITVVNQETPLTPDQQAPTPRAPAPRLPAPEVPAPQDPVPETPAPETPVPEVPAPQDPVPETPAPTLNLSADATTVDENGSTTIRWTSTNANSCAAFGGWTRNTGTTGNQSIASIPNTTTYSMTCTGDGGTASKSVTVTVIVAPPTPAPTLSISANPSTVTEGQNTVISWSSENTDSCNNVGGWTKKTTTTDMEQVGPLFNTQEFRITCMGAGGGISKSVSVTVKPNISVDTAELSWIPPTTNENGTSLTDLAGYTIHYGTTQTNLNQTITINNSGVSSYVVDNLTENTYYFAVKAFDSSGNESKASKIVSKSAK